MKLSTKNIRVAFVLSLLLIASASTQVSAAPKRAGGVLIGDRQSAPVRNDVRPARRAGDIDYGVRKAGDVSPGFFASIVKAVKGVLIGD